MILNFLKILCIMCKITLIKLSNLRKRKIGIAQHRTPNTVIVCDAVQYLFLFAALENTCVGNLLKRPERIMVLSVSFNTLSRCLLKINSKSKMNPRYFWELTL